MTVQQLKRNDEAIECVRATVCGERFNSSAFS